jgi:hypothetical protein
MENNCKLQSSLCRPCRCRGSGDIAPPSLSLGTTGRWKVNTRLRQHDPWWNYTLYPLHWRLGGPQSESGPFREQIKIHCPCHESNQDFSAIHPVALSLHRFASEKGHTIACGNPEVCVCGGGGEELAVAFVICRVCETVLMRLANVCRCITTRRKATDTPSTKLRHSKRT